MDELLGEGVVEACLLKRYLKEDGSHRSSVAKQCFEEMVPIPSLHPGSHEISGFALPCDLSFYSSTPHLSPPPHTHTSGPRNNQAQPSDIH